MKLLHEVVRLYTASVRGVSARVSAEPPGFQVTVPASLPKPTAVDAIAKTVSESAAVPVVVPRSEPASFLKAPRHLRQVSGR